MTDVIFNKLIPYETKERENKKVMIWKLSVKLSAWSLTVLTCNFCNHKNGALTKVKKIHEWKVKKASQVPVSYLRDYSVHSQKYNSHHITKHRLRLNYCALDIVIFIVFSSSTTSQSFIFRREIWIIDWNQTFITIVLN